MQQEGKIIVAMPRRSGESARGPWEAQDFVIETAGDFPRKMVFTVFGSERLQRFNVQEGQDVLVLFDIDAHEYNGRWYNSCRAYDVRPLAAANQQVPPPEAPYPSAPAPAPMPENNMAPAPDLSVADGGAEDDLPF